MMQARLNSLYEALYVGQADPANKFYDRLRGPDLVWLAPTYHTAKPRVLLIGQQPDGCDYSYREFLCDWTVARALEEYRRFNFGEHYNASPWWSFYNQLRFGLYGRECDRGVIGWTNLLKFVTPERESVLDTPLETQVLELQGNLFAREMTILEPDACVFATGPRYDRIIEKYYPRACFEDCGLGAYTLARVRHELLPRLSFRTYHPKALRLQNKWSAVLQELLAQIKLERAV